MKSLLLKLFTVLVALVVLAACGNDESSNNATQNQTPNENQANTTETSEQQEEATVKIVLSKDKEAEILEEKEVEINEGDILLDVMKENFNAEDKDGFITSLEGLDYDEENSMSWMFSINGESSLVGAGEVELKDGDVVNFDYQSWE
ncbi:DUF4430 domain-containing protein [Ornithinibacillus sp. JPR2-1]|uniref:DUF4430 domain-containing protein n=1 Tax=Ornithinibacillus sp. JPR2-1 TaxID=2094019 RepID=UPI0031DA362F